MCTGWKQNGLKHKPAWPDNEFQAIYSRHGDMQWIARTHNTTKDHPFGLEIA